MKSRKGQSTIIGFILVTVIAIIIVSLSLFWALPLLEKTNDQQEVQKLELKFLELHDAIKKTASEQGSMSIGFDMSKGILTLDNVNNTIKYNGQFNLANPIPRKAIFGNVSLSQVQNFNITAPGVLGQDEPAVLIEQASVQLFLHYRPLIDSSNKCYGIKLIPGGQPGAGVGKHTIILTWKGENSTISADCSAGLTEQLVEFDVR
jgi:hypothetical protein